MLHVSNRLVTTLLAFALCTCLYTRSDCHLLALRRGFPGNILQSANFHMKLFNCHHLTTAGTQAQAFWLFF